MSDVPDGIIVPFMFAGLGVFADRFCQDDRIYVVKDSVVYHFVLARRSDVNEENGP